ncbi:MAG: DUF2069 domain-containing protein [Burkholderiaceae bacterium]|nr:MAG: DUF2069 domain-containing protein [Burkholderiaceae bacterium]
MNAPNNLPYRIAIVSWIVLLLWCIAWETWLAPVHPGGSWLVLKALPLLLACRGLWRRPAYTMQWASLLIWLYFTEGVVRATSDAPATRWIAVVEIVLTLVFFVAAMLYLRPLKKAQKAREAGHVQ